MSVECSKDEILKYIDYAIAKTEERIIQRYLAEFETYTGVSLDDPESKKEFKASMLWLGSASKTSKIISCTGLVTLIGGICTGFLYVVWAGVKHFLTLKGL